MSLKKISLSFILLLSSIIVMNAQQSLDPEYIKVTTERAFKIVEKMELNNSQKEQEVTNLIAKQYQDLSQIQNKRDSSINDVKKLGLDNEKQAQKIDLIKKDSDKVIAKLHKTYIKNLGKVLNEEEIIKVKDGMTYGVVPITYAGYLDMLPNLTEAQKKMIYENLVEAREHAMDAGSSKEKHGWFGKYKGRINNKLSEQGYDLNKESTAWHERVEAREKEKSKN